MRSLGLPIVDATIAAERHHSQAFGALAAPLEAHAAPPDSEGNARNGHKIMKLAMDDGITMNKFDKYLMIMQSCIVYSFQ